MHMYRNFKKLKRFGYSERDGGGNNGRLCSLRLLNSAQVVNLATLERLYIKLFHNKNAFSRNVEYSTNVMTFLKGK